MSEAEIKQDIDKVQPDQARVPKSAWIALFALLLLLLASNIIWLEKSDFLLIGDAADHFRKASQVSNYFSTGTFPEFLNGEIEYAPLYYFWAGALMSIFNVSPQMAVMAIWPFLAVLCICCFLIAKEIVNWRIGIAVAALTCSAPLVLDYSRIPFLDLPATAMIWLLVYLTVKLQRSQKKSLYIIWGAIVGVTVLFRWTILPIVFFLNVWLFIKKRNRFTILAVFIEFIVALAWYYDKWPIVFAKAFNVSPELVANCPNGLGRTLFESQWLHLNSIWLTVAQVFLLGSFISIFIVLTIVFPVKIRSRNLFAGIIAVTIIPLWFYDQPSVRYMLPAVPAIFMLCTSWFQHQKLKKYRRASLVVIVIIAAFQIISWSIPISHVPGLVVRSAIVDRENSFSVFDVAIPGLALAMQPTKLDTPFDAEFEKYISMVDLKEKRTLCIAEQFDRKGYWITKSNFHYEIWKRNLDLAIEKAKLGESVLELNRQGRCDDLVVIRRSLKMPQEMKEVARSHKWDVQFAPDIFCLFFVGLSDKPVENNLPQ